MSLAAQREKVLPVQLRASATDKVGESTALPSGEEHEENAFREDTSTELHKRGTLPLLDRVDNRTATLAAARFR